MEQLKKQSFLTPQSKNSYPRIFSFQKTFSNINGETNSSSKRIVSDGNRGKMYLDNNGKVIISDLNSKELKKEFNLSDLNFNLNNYLKKNPFLVDFTGPNKYVFNKGHQFYRKRFNWNTFLLILIFFLLVFISIKLTFK